MEDANNCLNCGTHYKLCSTCESMRGRVFYWRQDFCSINCFVEYERGGSKMRIQYEGKTYTLAQYNHADDVYITTDKKKLKRKDIQGFMLNSKEMEEVLNYNKPTTRKKKVQIEEEE